MTPLVSLVIWFAGQTPGNFANSIMPDDSQLRFEDALYYAFVTGSTAVSYTHLTLPTICSV
eukprot:2813457-Prymnesium_polylepis.1